MITAFVVIVIVSFSFGLNPVLDLTCRQGLKIWRVDWEVLEILTFHGFFSNSSGRQFSTAPKKFKAFYLPLLIGGKTSIITLAFRFHCAEEAVKGPSSVASENHLQIKMHKTSSRSFDVLKLQAQEGKNG